MSVERPSHTVERHADEYTIAWPSERVSLRLKEVRKDRFGRLNGEVWAYLTDDVQANGSAAPPALVYFGQTRFDDPGERDKLATQLTKGYQRAGHRPEHLAQRVERIVMQTSVDVAKAQRALVKPVDLSDVVLLPASRRHLFETWMPLGDTTTIVADGESTKSTITRLLGLAVVTGKTLAGFRPLHQGPVLYCDWETNEQEFASSTLRLAKGCGLDAIPRGLYYIHLTRPLADVVGELRAEADRLGVVLVVFDSIAQGCRGSVNDDESAREYMNMVASFHPISRLAVTHVNKAAAVEDRDGRTDKKSAIGSRFFFDYSRSEWTLSKSDERTTANGSEADIVVEHTKRNGRRSPKPILLRWFFDADDDGPIRCQRIDNAPAAIQSMSPTTRLRYELGRSGKLYTSEIKALTGWKENNIRAIATRMPDVVNLSPVGGRREAQYALAADTASWTPVTPRGEPEHARDMGTDQDDGVDLD